MAVLKYSNIFGFMHALSLLLTLIINTALSDVLPSILWSTDNPFFRKLGDSPRTVFLKDQINFICPNTVVYPVLSQDVYTKDKLHANIYRVDKQGFDNCDATGGREIKICDKPNSVISAKVVIIKDVPHISFPVFKPGMTYYFIDTSDGTKENVSSIIGGKCQTQNMKMKFYVCKNQTDNACPYGNKVTDGGWSSWGECSDSSIQTRQCNNPTPTNGGNGCQGNHTKSCSIVVATTPKPTPTVKRPINNNDTVTPKREKRTSVADTLGTLSVGAVVAIFLAIFIFGIILGVLLGIFIAKNTKLKNKPFIVRRRKDKNAVDHIFNRDSMASTAKMRPFSTVSNDTTLTNVTGYTSYNDIYDQVK